MERTRRFCSECDWRGDVKDLLMADHPFDGEGARISGCPDCHAIGSEKIPCDEPDCWKSPSCGTNTPDGYRMLYSQHYRELQAAEMAKGE